MIGCVDRGVARWVGGRVAVSPAGLVGGRRCRALGGWVGGGVDRLVGGWVVALPRLVGAGLARWVAGRVGGHVS